MRKINGIVQSESAPSSDNLWLKDGALYALINGKWTIISMSPQWIKNNTSCITKVPSIPEGEIYEGAFIELQYKNNEQPKASLSDEAIALGYGFMKVNVFGKKDINLRYTFAFNQVDGECTITTDRFTIQYSGHYFVGDITMIIFKDEIVQHPIYQCHAMDTYIPPIVPLSINREKSIEDDFKVYVGEPKKTIINEEVQRNITDEDRTLGQGDSVVLEGETPIL